MNVKYLTILTSCSNVTWEVKLNSNEIQLSLPKRKIPWFYGWNIFVKIVT